MRISDNQEVILGPPGTGKTRYCLEHIDELLKEGESPDRIAFVSFTKKAINEATERAAEKFNVKPRQLPLFKTIHALCFSGLGIGKSDVVGKEHYRELGEWLGYTFEGTWDETEGIPIGSEKGDTLLFLDNLARVTQKPLREVWEENYSECEWAELERFQEGYQDFKSSKYIMDFTDMLSAYVSMCDSSKARYVIVDEAQDLSSLQWSVLKHAFGNVIKSTIAGDDDQSIFRWSGASVESFLQLEGEKKVLSQSYRLPRSVYEMANGIVSKIESRFDKPFRNRDSEGEVNYTSILDESTLNPEESTLFLVRNTYIMKRVQEYMIREGIPYINKFGYSSIRKGHLKAIKAMEDLRKGDPILGSEAKEMYEAMRVGKYLERGHKNKIVTLNDNEVVTFAKLRDEYGLKDVGVWYTTLEGIGEDVSDYYRRCRGNGYTLQAAPKCSISTIHAAKGGEAEHVIVLSDMAYRSFQEYVKTPDNERRVAYVGITRAKERLTIVQPQTKLFFDYSLESS